MGLKWEDFNRPAVQERFIQPAVVIVMLFLCHFMFSLPETRLSIT